MGACWSDLWGRRHATDPERELELLHMMRQGAEDAVKEVHMLKAEKNELEAKLLASEKANTMAGKQLSQNKREIGILRLDLGDSKREIAKVKEDLEASQSVIVNHKEKVWLMNRQIESLLKDQEASKRETINLKVELEISKKEMANLEVNLEESKTANLHLQQEVMEKQKQKDESENRCVTFSDANIQLKWDLADLRRIVAEQEEQIETLQAKLPLKL